MSQLLHVILFTPDLSRLRAYYAETLGFEPEGDDPPHWVDFRTSGAVLALHPTSEHHAQHVQLSEVLVHPAHDHQRLARSVRHGRTIAP